MESFEINGGRGKSDGLCYYWRWEVYNYGILGTDRKVMTEKPYRALGLFAFLKQAWKVKKSIEIREVGENLHIFQFFLLEDKSKVMQGRPCIFDKQIILLSEGEENMTPLEVKIMHVNF